MAIKSPVVIGRDGPADEVTGRDVAGRLELLTVARGRLASGIWNMERNAPAPFMADMNKYGLPWQEKTLDHKPLAGIQA